MLSKKLLEKLEDYIELHLLSESISLKEDALFESLESNLQYTDLVDFIETRKKASFSQLLLKFIDEKELSDPVVYKKAGMDRRHFSKIRTNPDYRPGKSSVLSLVLALELNKEEADELLAASGYSLSDSDRTDLVIQFCLDHHIYELIDVNLALEHFGLKPLNV